MVGQVGGVSVHKRPLLTLAPDYVLKPLQGDHRGVREAGFYEAIELASRSDGVHLYADMLEGKKSESTDILDFLGMWFAIRLQDRVVTNCEQRIWNSWRTLKREVELLRRLQKFTASYYGILGQVALNNVSPYGISEDAHLLLQDITIHFSKPCVMDLKLGSQTYEPSAPLEKQKREYSKYPLQSKFGFRIVGMRIYQPSDEMACENGFLFFSKEYGRALATKDDLKRAFETYFSAGVDGSSSAGVKASVRARSISNIVTKLHKIQTWFRDNKSLCFCASSLLIAYEGDTQSSSNPDVVNVKMIDFGRVRRHPGGDPGYTLGLETICALMVELLKEVS